jgi:hypothetical protein
MARKNILCPVLDEEIWKSGKRASLKQLDRFFEEITDNQFTYTRLDEMRTELIIYLGTKQNSRRWQSYSFFGMGEIRDFWKGEKLEGHVRVDPKHGLNVFSLHQVRDLYKILRAGLPILLVWDEHLQPLGENRSYPNYLFF